MEPAPLATTGDGAAAGLTATAASFTQRSSSWVTIARDRAPTPSARRKETRDDRRTRSTTAPPIPIPKVEELFQHIPHPRIAERKHEKPVKVNDERVGINGKVALIITAVVGTMWCAYIFTLLALISLPPQ